MEHLTHIWPCAHDLAQDLDVPYQTVASWRRRGIPHRRFPEIIRAAAGRGHTLTYEYLTDPQAAAPQPEAAE